MRFNSRDEAQARRMQGLRTKPLAVLRETKHRTNALHGLPQEQRDLPQARSALCRPTSTAGVPATGLMFNQRRRRRTRPGKPLRLSLRPIATAIGALWQDAVPARRSQGLSNHHDGACRMVQDFLRDTAKQGAAQASQAATAKNDQRRVFRFGDVQDLVGIIPDAGAGRHRACPKVDRAHLGLCQNFLANDAQDQGRLRVIVPLAEGIVQRCGTAVCSAAHPLRDMLDHMFGFDHPRPFLGRAPRHQDMQDAQIMAELRREFGRGVNGPVPGLGAIGRNKDLFGHGSPLRITLRLSNSRDDAACAHCAPSRSWQVRKRQSSARPWLALPVSTPLPLPMCPTNGPNVSIIWPTASGGMAGWPPAQSQPAGRQRRRPAVGPEAMHAGGIGRIADRPMSRRRPRAAIRRRARVPPRSGSSFLCGPLGASNRAVCGWQGRQ